MAKKKTTRRASKSASKKPAKTKTTPRKSAGGTLAALDPIQAALARRRQALTAR
jgi:hypothetical protein